MADPVVSVLLEKLVTFLIDEGSQLLEFEDQLDEIKKEFLHMQNYVKDADRVRRRDRSETLRQIMNDVRELIYDAEEIIANCQLLCQKKNKQGWASPCLSPTLLKSRCVLGRKLRDVDKRIKQVKQNIISYLAAVPVHGKREESGNIPLIHPVLISDDSIVGLEDESRRILNSLLVKEDYLKVLGIVGMGGIGKTTLAQKICKSEMIETQFKPLIFVTVSQTFKFDELVKKMLNKVGVADGSLQGRGVDDLLEMLKDQLDGKYPEDYELRSTEDSFFSVNDIDSKLPRRVVMYENSKAVTPILEANLKRLLRLRTLRLQFSNEIDETVKSAKWVNGIGSLHHLLYLHLQNIHALTTLPDSIGDLRNLQILHIIRCKNLDSLPPSITKLEKLIALFVVACEKLERLPKGLGKLSNLEQLMQLILEISTGEQVGEEEWTPLQMPESLQILILGFTGVTPACEAGIARKIDRPLCHPLQYLKELYLYNCPGESTPTWLSPTSLPNLCHLCIWRGRIKNMGPEFYAEGARWKLETLVLVNLEELEDDWAMIERAMPFLRQAHVENCLKLKHSEKTFQPDRHGWMTWKKYIRGKSFFLLLSYNLDDFLPIFLMDNRSMDSNLQIIT
ncbi:hypothetical protein ACLOJK_007580 [Asimina triloba]